MANRPCFAAFVACPMSLGAIFNHLEPMRPGQRHDGVHIAHPAAQVDADHGFGLRRQHARNGLGCDVATLPVYVGEHRRSPCIDHAGNAGDEGARRYHHLIAGANTQRLQRQVQCEGAVGQRNGMLRARPVRKLFFKLATLRAGPVVHLVGQHNLPNGVGLFNCEARPGGKGGIQHLASS